MRIPTSNIVFPLLAVALLAFPAISRADSISIIPPKFDLFGNPGDTITDKIKVTNGSSASVVYQVIVEDFNAAGENGGISLQEDPESPSTNISLARWVSVSPSRFTVPANVDKVIDFSIKIPKGAEPGGKYASILITRAGDKVDGGASVTSRVGSLVLLRVSGAVTEQLSLASFKTDDSYYQKGPVSLTLRSTNTGNVHVAPKGTIVISNIFGQKVKELPITEANVLPNSTRAVKMDWNDVGLVGRYTASLVGSYGTQNLPLVATTTFTVFPLWLMATLFGVLFVLYLLISQRKSFKKLINRLTSD